MSKSSSDILTDREHEVLILIAQGYSNKAIAEHLVLSKHTVAWYVRQIFSKLHVNRRTQAVAVARKQRLLQPVSQPPAVDISLKTLPPQLTSFIGREHEIDEVCALLPRKDCHLLTLVGPGGIGKTRLVLEVAPHLSSIFRDGIYFVALQPIASVQDLVPTIASVLGVQLLSDGSDALRQVIDYCKGKSLLLIMDNFEHMLDGVGIISQLLHEVPQLKILITSRESLNLYEEQLYTVTGLPFPETNKGNHESDYSAVELFVARAQQIIPDFDMLAELHDVIQICQLVDGVPLALELAASWLKSLSCSAIADEIEQGLGILVSPLRNMPERHRSMRAVFDYSWQLLSDEERTVFRRLSIFQGSCTYDAAVYVSGATPLILQALVDKSFIRRTSQQDDQYSIHELLRQYGSHKLKEQQDEFDEIRRLHCRYYMELLATQRENVTNCHQLDMMELLEPDLDNIRLAWKTASSCRDVELIDNALNTFAYFHVFRSRFLEEARELEATIEHLENENLLPDHRQLLAGLYSYCGWIYVRIGSYDKATFAFHRSRDLYEDYCLAVSPGWGSEPLTGLTLLSSIQGDYDAAQAYGVQACVKSAKNNDRWNLQLALYCSTSAYFHQGAFNEARESAEEALNISKDSGDRWFRAIVLNDLGSIARVLGDLTLAKEYYHQSLKLREQFKDAQGMAAALNHLGIIAIEEGNITEARQFFETSYRRYRDVGDLGGMGYALCGIGVTACNDGDYDAAHVNFVSALQIASELEYMPFTFAILITMCELLVHEGLIEDVVEIITMTLHHEHADHEARRIARQMLSRLQDKLESESIDEDYPAQWQTGQSAQPKMVVLKLLSGLENT